MTLYARLYRAAAHQALGRAQEAADDLLCAVRLAFPDGVFMPFAEIWRHIADIAPAGRDAALADGFARAGDLAAHWERRRRGIVARYFSDGASPLDDHEMDLVRMVMSGMRYRDIADATSLASTTIKRAFVRIYAKLGISTREELAEYMERMEQKQCTTQG